MACCKELDDRSAHGYRSSTPVVGADTDRLVADEIRWQIIEGQLVDGDDRPRQKLLVE